MRRPPKGPFSYQGVSIRGVRHSPGLEHSRILTLESLWTLEPGARRLHARGHPMAQSLGQPQFWGHSLRRSGRLSGHKHKKLVGPDSRRENPRKERLSWTQKVYARPLSTVKHREFLTQNVPCINFWFRPIWLLKGLCLKIFVVFSIPKQVDGLAPLVLKLVADVHLPFALIKISVIKCPSSKPLVRRTGPVLTLLSLFMCCFSCSSAWA